MPNSLDLCVLFSKKEEVGWNELEVLFYLAVEFVHRVYCLQDILPSMLQENLSPKHWAKPEGYHDTPCLYMQL